QVPRSGQDLWCHCGSLHRVARGARPGRSCLPFGRGVKPDPEKMWLHLWSCARYDLHLSSEEFYALTPRQFDALIKRHRHTVESNELLLGQLTSWVANTGFRSTEKPTHPHDFMPSQWGKASASVASSSV